MGPVPRPSVREAGGRSSTLPLSHALARYQVAGTQPMRSGLLYLRTTPVLCLTLTAKPVIYAESMAARRKRRPVQMYLSFPNRGGPRQGAGRKPKGNKAGVKHEPRGPLASRHPVHVTLRLRSGLASLRRKGEYAVLLGCFEKARERFGFRLVHYSVQNNHLHLLVEAKGREALSRGMQGLMIRLAKGLNRHWNRKGRVFADRFHDRVLKTPKEVRSALVYVLHNAKKHGLRMKLGMDYFSSGAWFRGWKESFTLRGHARRACSEARTWLLSVGWRKRGLVSLWEQPQAAPG